MDLENVVPMGAEVRDTGTGLIHIENWELRVTSQGRQIVSSGFKGEEDRLFPWNLPEGTSPEEMLTFTL